MALREIISLDEISGKIAGKARIESLQSAEHAIAESGKHNVFVIAANRLVRDLLCDRVATGRDFKLIGSEQSVGTAMLELEKATGHIVVLLWLSGLSNPEQFLDQIETLRGTCTPFRLVLIGMPSDERIFLAAVRAGVAGYVLNDATMDEVLAAVQRVALGEVVCPSQLLPFLFRWAASQPDEICPRTYSDQYGLSRRERQLLPLIARGMTNKEIASELCLSEQTVKNHLRRMMRKSGADNRFAIVERCQVAAAAGMWVFAHANVTSGKRINGRVD